MTKSARRLGRGLDSLISDLTAHPQPAAPPGGGRMLQDIPHSAQPGTPTTRAAVLPVDELDPNPYQPRTDPGEPGIASLAQSIKNSGLLQPIAVRAAGSRYQIIAGERRWLAAKSIGISTVPVLIRRATDEQMLELALIENIQREDLNAIDRARAYRRFCESFHLTAEEVAQRVGEDRSTVANYVRLLELPAAIQQRVADRSLSMGHARCLLGLPEERRRIQLSEAAVRKQLSVRALEEIVRRERECGKETETRVSPSRDGSRSVHLYSVEQRFEEALKTKVSIHEGRKKGTGRITIEYYSLDDFDRIAVALGIIMHD